MLLEKLNGFAEGKYDVHTSGAQIAEDYEAKRTDAWEVIENMGITKRIVSTAKMMQTQRQISGGSSTLGRSNTTLSTSTASSAGTRGIPPSRSPVPSSFVKKSPPPPPTFGAPAAPPPYSAAANASSGSAASVAAATKRAPPPPPPMKPKLQPRVQYVVALYDFVPQAEGDLEFNVGDRIEVVERTESTEDWWTGRLNGRQGVFPGNCPLKITLIS